MERLSLSSVGFSLSLSHCFTITFYIPPLFVLGCVAVFLVCVSVCGFGVFVCVLPKRYTRVCVRVGCGRPDSWCSVFSTNTGWIRVSGRSK